MKLLKLVITLLITYNATSQNVKVSIDPQIVFKENALDIKLEVSDNSYEYNYVSVQIEYFKAREYFSFGLNYGKKIYVLNSKVIPTIEVGQIFRKGRNDSTQAYIYYGFNLKFEIPIAENYGIYLNSNYTRRTDIGLFRYSNFGGVYYDF